jgi:hypothetical protein
MPSHRASTLHFMGTDRTVLGVGSPKTAKLIGYEVDQMVMARVAMSGQQVPMVAVSNAVLESYGVHTRGLLEFFAPRGDSPRETDVVAADFVDAESATRIESNLRASLKPFAEDIKRRIPDVTEAISKECAADPVCLTLKLLDWRLAHATTHRLMFEDDKSWRLDLLDGPLTEAWRAFIDALPADRLGWFDPAKG